MQPDRRPEIPTGYVWKNLTPIHGKIPMPDTWFYKQVSLGNTRGFFVSRENIDTNGYFVTGLSINTFLHADQSFNTAPSHFVRTYMKTGLSHLMPTTDLRETQEGVLTVCRQEFFFEGGIVQGRRMEPTSFSIEFTGNDRTGTVYGITFETPFVKWGEDQIIAKKP